MIKDLVKVAVISTSIIVAIAVLFSYLDGEPSPESAAKTTEPASSNDPAPIVPARRVMPPPAPAHNASDAWVMCQVFAERRLRAPSTAKWPHRPDSGIKETDTRYRVTGYVDAQNAFGAMIRNRVMCVIEYAGDGKWTIHEVAVE